MNPHGEQAHELAGHAHALRRLARGLLFDPGQADDVVQRAWIEALRRERAGASRAWLAGVVRNLARQTRRDEARRAVREQLAARPEAEPSALEALERLEGLRRIVTAVQELEEPYRSTILLRFFDDLPPRKIARRQGVPVNTVRTRVQRGLALLRRRLGDERDGPTSALAALLPLAGPLPLPLALSLSAEASTVLKWSGAVSTTTKIPLIAAGALFCALSILTWRVLDGRSDTLQGPAAASAETDRPAAPLTAPAPRGRDDLLVPASTRETREATRAAVHSGGPWIVRGRVLRGRDEPFERAAIEARRWLDYEARGEPAETVRLVSDAEGRFEWALPEPLTAAFVRVSADLPGYTCQAAEHLAVPGETAPQSLELQAHPLDFVITGRVLDPDGNAVADARVIGASIAARSDASGHYRLPAPSSYSRVFLYAEATGFAQVHGSVQPVGPGIDAQLEFTLGRELRVSGRVLDEDGQPLAGARVGAFGLADLETTSDAEGRFVVQHIDREERDDELYASKPGFLMSRVPLAEGADGEMQVDVVLQRGVRVEGRVVYEDGRPIPGASLTVGHSTYDFEGVSTVSRDGGAFVLEGIGRGPRVLWVRRAGIGNARYDFVVPESGALLQGLEVVLGLGRFIGGFVVDDTGAPRAGVWITPKLEGDYLEDRVRTDDEGRFRIDGLPEGSLGLEVYGRGITRHEVVLAQLDRDDLRIEVLRAGELAGKVVDGTTGAPIASFAIRFVEPLLQADEERLSGYTSDWHDGLTLYRPDGTWSSGDEELKPGSVVGIEASAPGFAPAVAEHVVVGFDPDPEDLVLALFPGVSVHGRVVAAASGAAVEGALVLRTTGAHPFEPGAYDPAAGRMWTRTDADGRFELSQVPAGPMGLAVLHPDWTRALDGPFDVPVAGNAPVRHIALVAGGSIAGQLLSAGGTPIADARIQASCIAPAAGPSGGGRDARTDADGRFAFEHLEDGVWQVSRGLERGDTTLYDLSTPVTVEDGAHAEIELRPRGTATLHGTLRFSGTLPEGIALSARRLDPPATTASFETWRAAWAEGDRFSIEGLEPGEWLVSASRLSLQGSTRVTLAEGAVTEVWIDLVAHE